jgi:hypothetical protein
MMTGRRARSSAMISVVGTTEARVMVLARSLAGLPALSNALACRAAFVYAPRRMRPRRPMCSSLAILCTIAITTASLPAVAASTHDVIAHVAIEPPVEPAPVDPAPVDAAPPEPATPPVADPLPVDAPPVDPAPPEPTKAAPTTTTPIEPTPKPTPKPEPPPEAEEEIPERLAPLQVAGWWTLFGGVSIGTLAAVMAGLAERQEDRALRLSVFFDIETRAQSRYEDVQGEYEAALRKGRAQANAGIALAVVGLGAAVAGVAMLAVAARNQRRAAKPKSNARLQWRMGGMQVRF